MTPPEIDYTLYAGFVRFPAGLHDLTDDSRCAACFAPITGDTCTACGLDFTHADVERLRTQSLAAAELLEDRLITIGRIRHAADERAADEREAVNVAVSAVVAVPPTPPSPFAAPAHRELTRSLPELVEPARANPPRPPRADGAPPTGAPRRSGVQVLLLGVGVSLLAIAAIFFMVFAFVAFGIFVRALIIAGITAATVAGATTLRRRRLFGTAEAVAALAIVLVLLDAWALRANGLLGLDRTDAGPYWGITLILTAVGLRVWQQYSGLRTPGVAGALMLPLGAGIAALGLASSAASGGAFVGALAISVAALVHPIFAPRRGGTDASVQRYILLAWAAVGVALALATVATLLPSLVSGVSLGLLALAAVALAHALVLARTTGVADRRDWSARIIAPAGALSAVLLSLAPAALALRSQAPVVAIAVPVLGAAAVALALEAAVSRAPVGARPAMSLGVRCTAVVAAVLSLIPLSIAALSALRVCVAALQNTRALALGEIIGPVSVEAVTAVITLAMLAAALWVVWIVLQDRHPRGPLVVALGLLVVTAAMPVLGVFALIVGGWVLVAAAGLGWMLRRGAKGRAGLVIAVFSGLNGALAYMASWAGEHTWWAVSLVCIALLLSARRLFSRSTHAPRALLLAAALGASYLAVAGLAGLGSGTSVLGSTGDAAVRDAAAGLLVLALIAVATATLPLRGLLSEVDRRTLFWPSAVVAAASTLALIMLAPSRLAPSGLLLSLAALLVAVLIVWSLAPLTRPLVAERVVAAVAVAPAVSWMLQSFARVLGLEELLGGGAASLGGANGFSAGGAVGATAALLVSAAALVGTLRRAPVVSRSFTDVGIGIVLVVAVGQVAVTEVFAVTASLGWLTLLIAACAVLLQSISGDGLFASASSRRLLGWVAFALAVSALWLRLFDASVTMIEPFTLPVAAGLLSIAVLIERVEHRRGMPSAVAPSLVLAGMLLALLPSAMQGTSGAVVRPVLVVAIGGALLLAARWAPVPERLRPFAVVVAVAGAAGVAVAAGGRAALSSVIFWRGQAGELPDLWAAVGCVILFVAGMAYVRRRRQNRAEATLTTGLFLAAGTGLLGAEALRLESEPGAVVRSLALVIIFAVLHVAASMATRLPSPRLLAGVALGYAVVAALLGLRAGLLDPIEIATLPLAVALLASGTWRLRTNPALRSVPALGPGLLVLFVPSLLITASDRDLWRVVLIGVVGIAVIVVGVTRRLQAPFLIGSAVVLIHAIGTFSPQIRYVYEATPWWLWVALGGGLLLFLGATYERRARDLRRSVGRIAALR